MPDTTPGFDVGAPGNRPPGADSMIAGAATSKPKFPPAPPSGPKPTKKSPPGPGKMEPVRDFPAYQDGPSGGLGGADMIGRRVELVGG